MPIAFIVDGMTEKLIVQRLCNGTQVRTTELNGQDVSIEAIANKVESLVKLFRDRFYPIFVIVDRENRSYPAMDLENNLKRLLENKNIDTSNLIITFADRMIENWIVAGCRKYGETEEIIGCEDEAMDDKGGKAIIKTHFRSKKLSYGETTDGVNLFCEMDFELASRRSFSFKRFATRVKPYCQKFAQKNFD